jgi:hypothetical protein
VSPKPDFLFCFAQRSLEQRCVAGLALAAGETELPSVDAERATDDEHEAQLARVVSEDRHEDGCSFRRWRL